MNHYDSTRPYPRDLTGYGPKPPDAQWPGQAIRISAQARLREFYAGLGFEAVSDTYIEDQIPHMQMLRSAS